MCLRMAIPILNPKMHSYKNAFICMGCTDQVMKVRQMHSFKNAFTVGLGRVIRKDLGIGRFCHAGICELIRTF